MSFAKFKAMAYASGKVNDCSAKKIYTDAKVDGSYLYKKELSDKVVEAAYRKIGTAIKTFRDDFQSKKGTDEENTALTIAQASIDCLTKERNDSLVQGARYLKQVQEYKSRLSKMTEAQNNLIAQQTYTAHASQGKLAAPVIKVNFTETVVVEPDRHLYVNGKYSSHDENVVNAAWRVSKDELEKAMSQQNLTRIYMLVGPPCSGKSHWARDPELYVGGYRPIIIDACNLTQMKRHQWFRIIEKSESDYKICAVFFDTPLSKLFKRNKGRSPDKQMPDTVIEDKFKSLEMVNLAEEEYIDEIKVVRNNGTD
jgi:hypothetical protein